MTTDQINNLKVPVHERGSISEAQKIYDERLSKGSYVMRIRVEDIGNILSAIERLSIKE